MGSRSYVFTLNNPTGIPDFESIPHCRYGIMQLEQGESGTVHYQGYLELAKPLRVAAIKKAERLLEGAHFETRKGTREQAREYCQKPESRLEDPIEFGTWIGGQGTRTDIGSFKTAIDTGATDLALWDSHPLQYLRFNRVLGTIRLLKSQQRNWPMEVQYLYGAPGTGKSETALTENPSAYWKNKSGWWDGYTGQDTVILDEMDGTWFPWTTLMKLLDKTPLNVEIKGGCVPFVPKKIVITTNRAPWALYNRVKFPLQALFRRVTMWKYHQNEMDPFIFQQVSDLYQAVTTMSWENWLLQQPSTVTHISTHPARSSFEEEY